MNKVKLSELLEIKNGKTYFHLIEGDIPVYGSGGFMLCVNKHIYDGESILLPRKGTLDNIQYVNGKFWTVDTIYYTKVSEHVNAYYLYNYLKLLNLSRLDSGSALPSMTQSSYYDLEINLPTKHIQDKTANAIKSIDSKIELNNKINTELEAMAKTLYDYWFVQFDFPNAEGKPYKSSGGKMVWSEELKRWIPEGWEVGGLGNILNLEYGKPMKNEDRSGSGYPVLGSNGIVGYHKEYLVEGPGVVVGRKGTAGAIVWVEDNFYPIDTTFYVKDILGVNQLFFHYLLLLRSDIKQGESSSAVPGLNRNFAHSVNVVIPEISLINNFNIIVEPFFSKIKMCNKESQILKELRDWLLPMLMNGQVKV
jgi:type I restriction enzyme S subunit